MGVLVTGGAGYIGSHLVLKLGHQREQVVVVDNLSTGFRSAVDQMIPFVQCDVGDLAKIRNVIKTYDIDAIFHFAGSVVVPESIVDPLKYYYNNTCQTRALIEAAVLEGVKHFIFSSTAAVYGMPEISPIGEEVPTVPISPYGTSKLMVEWMLRDIDAAHSMTYIVLRYFNVAGADPSGSCGQLTENATHLIKVACEAALGQRTHVSVFGNDYETVDGTGVRDYIHVCDLVEAHILALAFLRGGGTSRVFNCGYGRGFSVLQVLEAVKRVSGVDFNIAIEERRLGDPAEIIARASNIRGELNWLPRYEDLDLIVEHALNWEKKKYIEVK